MKVLAWNLKAERVKKGSQSVLFLEVQKSNCREEGETGRCGRREAVRRGALFCIGVRALPASFVEALHPFVLEMNAGVFPLNVCF